MIQMEMQFETPNKSSLKSTQDNMILESLKRNESMTSLDAYNRYGIMRLASCIHRLRKNFNISTLIIEVLNRRGQPCHVASYKYSGQKQAAPKDGL